MVEAEWLPKGKAPPIQPPEPVPRISAPKITIVSYSSIRPRSYFMTPATPRSASFPQHGTDRTDGSDSETYTFASSISEFVS